MCLFCSSRGLGFPVGWMLGVVGPALGSRTKSGSQGPCHHPSQKTGSWGAQGTSPAPGIRQLLGNEGKPGTGQDVSPWVGVRIRPSEGNSGQKLSEMMGKKLEKQSTGGLLWCKGCHCCPSELWEQHGVLLNQGNQRYTAWFISIDQTFSLIYSYSIIFWEKQANDFKRANWKILHDTENLINTTQDMKAEFKNIKIFLKW